MVALAAALLLGRLCAQTPASAPPAGGAGAAATAGTPGGDASLPAAANPSSPPSTASGDVHDTIALASSTFPLDDNAAVARYIHLFTTTDREDFVAHLDRGGRYRSMVESIFQQHDIPPELFYVADVESGFDVYCLSHSGARGMWQFVAGRATDYGLKHNSIVDERQDPEKSTVAAARYFKDLYAQFGDWYLAVAAYVTGPVTVERAVSRTGTADFWELSREKALSQNARDYIPVLVATAIVAEHPGQYGLSLREDPPERFDSVHLEAPVSLQLAADCAGVGLAQLEKLNPSLLRARAPAGFDLHVPPDTASRFIAALALVPPDQRLSWRAHRMQPGETLSAVAHSYNVEIERLIAANQLNPAIPPDPGQWLVIPASTPAARAGFVPPPVDATGIIRYRVVSGDTWWALARRFHVTQAQLHAWNPGGGAVLHVGRVLTIRRDAAASAAAIAQ